MTDEKDHGAELAAVGNDTTVATPQRQAHTSGPWTVILRGERGTFHIPEAQRHEAEHVDDGVDGFTVSSANARLIAAAPDLLAALKAMVASYDGLRDALTCKTVIAKLAAADAAIAKAEGR